MERATDEVWPLEAVPPSLAKQLPEWQRIIAQLEMTRADIDQTTLPRPQGAVRGWLGRWFLFLQFSALTLFALYSAWQNSRFSDWVSFWIFAGAAALLSLVAAYPAMNPLGPMPPALRGDDALALREAVARGDDIVAPRSPPNPQSWSRCRFPHMR